MLGRYLATKVQKFWRISVSRLLILFSLRISLMNYKKIWKLFMVVGSRKKRLLMML